MFAGQCITELCPGSETSSLPQTDEPSLYTVKAVFILDNDGNRLLSKYYDPELYPSIKEQRNFETNVFNKTHKADSKFVFLPAGLG
uniref:Coatomer subunit zeta n=1 Tax=Oryzias sinensis TaxID=183150 RepID=A0A8C7Z4Y8_9TELE